MTSSIPRGAGYICRMCESKQLQFSRASLRSLASTSNRSFKRRQISQDQLRTLSTQSRLPPGERVSSASGHNRHVPKAQQPAKREVTPKPSNQSTSTVPINAQDTTGTLRKLRNDVNAIAASNQIPDEARVLEIMDQAYQYANLLVFGQTTAPDEETKNEGEILSERDNLLSDLEEQSDAQSSTLDSELTSTSPTSPRANLPSASFREKAAYTTSETIYQLLKDPKTTITEPLLSIYIRIICQLGRPEFLPEIFFLYANKPQPLTTSKPITPHAPIQYKTPNPKAVKNAIPQELSDVALDTAILSHDLPLAIAIIDNTVATSSFRRSKLLRRASLPLSFAAVTPVGAYAVADWVASNQVTLDPQLAKGMTIACTMAYIGTLTTLGFVALTTYNDHHDRVVWTPGTPLRERWLREEERLYFDRIAMAWGFQQRVRRGEEMGEEWEALRDVLGVRGMILDKSDFLEGMQ